MSDFDIKQQLHDSFIKEYLVLTSRPRPSEIKYSNLFKNTGRSIHDHIPYNSDMIDLHIKTIDDWISKIESNRYYPKFSDKLCSRSSSRIACKLGLIPESYELTITDLELIYHNEGIRIDGDCEMRQAWFPSNLSPRTYYCMGGYAYHRAKYVQSMFNDLVDRFDPTNKRLCVRPTRIILRNGNYAYIYDLESFTSNLHEQIHYLTELSHYCRHRTTTLFDSHEGFIEVHLSDLFSEFAQLHRGLLVSLERIATDNKDLVLTQEVAGLLGVYGNITSAKWLHGVLMSQFVQELDELNVAGDDGIIAIDDHTDPYAGICVLGKMESTKVYDSREAGAICLKRPISQVESTLIQGSLVNWPLLEYPELESEVDPRYPSIRHMSKYEKKSAVASSVMTFLQELQWHSLDNGRKFIEEYVSYVYDSTGLNPRGNVPQVSGEGFFTPCILGDYIGKDPLRYTLEQHYRGIGQIQLRGTLPFEPRMIDESTFRCNSDAYLSTLIRLGFLSEARIELIVIGDDGFDRIMNEYLALDRVVVEYTVLRYIPAVYRIV